MVLIETSKNLDISFHLLRYRYSILPFGNLAPFSRTFRYQELEKLWHWLHVIFAIEHLHMAWKWTIREPTAWFSIDQSISPLQNTLQRTFLCFSICLSTFHSLLVFPWCNIVRPRIRLVVCDIDQLLNQQIVSLRWIVKSYQSKVTEA